MNVVRSFYGAELTAYRKTGADFATDADLEAEAAVLAELRAARPDDGTLGEETGASEAERSRTWLIDPLCGTRNFAAHAGGFCVNVALRDAGTVRVAAVADPASASVYWTDGEVAVQRIDGADAPIQPSSRSRIIELNADGPSDRIGPDLISDQLFRSWMSPRVSASTIVLPWVASGRRAAYVSDGALVDDVHFAAGIALCVAAGCVVTDLSGGPVGTGQGLAISADEVTHRPGDHVVVSDQVGLLLRLLEGSGQRRRQVTGDGGLLGDD
jgi:myo-inositol-1(or 4)-monophosphatase